jgi:predicted N-formylglutamate amidohydrolase
MTKTHPVFHPVEHISPGSNPTAITGLLLLCDHARNAVPPEIGDLGLPPEDMGRHIAWDVGARGVTLGLAARLGAGAVLSTYSRLVIDPNRGEDDPTLVMRLYDGSIIPGNRHVDQAEIERRKNAPARPRCWSRSTRSRRSSRAARIGPGMWACYGTMTTGCCARCWRGFRPMTA